MILIQKQKQKSENPKWLVLRQKIDLVLELLWPFLVLLLLYSLYKVVLGFQIAFSRGFTDYDSDLQETLEVNLWSWVVLAS